MYLLEKFDRLKRLKAELLNLGVDALKETEKEFLDLNRDELRKGKNVQGGQIGEYASKYYANLKYRMNPSAHGKVDLYYTGSFTDLMKIEVNGSRFVVDSDDGKNSILQKKYGSAVSFFGLGGDAMQVYRRQHFFPALMPKVHTLIDG